uniref:UspA domain-containing protein n=1 Tax=Oryza brachyantha TaxID=4533 RepID=J3MDD2_ORYBR
MAEESREGGGSGVVDAVEDDEITGGGGDDRPGKSRGGKVDDDKINNGSTWEIEEMEDDQHRQPAGPPPPPPAADVYVAGGKGGSSMEALSWALRRLASPRSFVYLVHVFPVVISIPTALGMMPKSQARPEQVETYMNQERSKRRVMLQKYLDHCRNFQVNVDVHLIESDHVADAILELIPVFHVKQLVLGVSKSNLRRFKRGSTIAGQVQKNAPIYCEVKIVCDDKEVTTATTADPTPPLSPAPVNNKNNSVSPTPMSPATNHNIGAAADDKNETNLNERNKITKYLKCFSF